MFFSNRLKRFLLKCLPLVVIVCTFLHLFRTGPSRGFDGGDGEADVSGGAGAPPVTLPFSLPVLADLIRAANRKQLILNQDRFGPTLGPDDPVLVIQVHNRDQYLSALIESLRNVRGINRSLLIFSHDLFDIRINAIIEQIDFCKVLQIFYPFSLQLHPNQFPGTDPRDCPRDSTKEEAIARKCLNAQTPDSYGHYREAKYTQTKHHWFWKTNQVFDGLRATRNHSGPFVFLEEDHYAAPDLLYMLQTMNRFRQSSCPQCDLMTLGIYVKSVNYVRNGRRVEIQKWISSRHNMAMVLDRSLWQQIRNCAKQFCYYDDYNWDWSLQHVSLKCLRRPMNTLVVSAPRVFHVGECGVHHKGKRCDTLIRKVEDTLAASVKFLFPKELMLQSPTKRTFKMAKGNGGWGDRRDHELCMSHLLPNSSHPSSPIASAAIGPVAGPQEPQVN